MIQERTEPADEPRASRDSGRSESRGESPEQAPTGGRGLFHRQRQAAIEELRSVAGVLRNAAASLEETEDPGLGDYVRKAAAYVEGISSSLGQRELEDLLHQAEGTFRERPALGLGVSLGMGFVLGRFLRSSSRRVSRRLQARNASASEGGIP